MNKKQINLGDYGLETDYSVFDASQYTSLKGSVRSAVLGQGDFSPAQLFMSSYDLKEASKKYKFALLPRVC